ncbi:MAG: hypothetical protein RL596_1959, partial [Bacteroidota bacterium]
MDQFKKYLQENRSELDSDTPRPMVWDRIEHELPAPAKAAGIMRMVAWSAAACVLVMAGVGISRFARNEERVTSYGLREVANNKLRDTSYGLREVANNKLRDTSYGLREVTTN